MNSPNSRRRLSYLAVGTVVLILAAAVLLSSPASFFSPTVTFIDTELYRSTGRELAVRTRTDFGNPEVVAVFPRQIGKWQGTDHDVTEYVEMLGANLILLRGYEPQAFTQPVFLTIVQGDTESSFHPPKVCLTGQGYRVQDEGDDAVVLTDSAFTGDSSPRIVPFKKLVVTKHAKDGSVKERRVVLFCYVKGNRFYSDITTLIQVEALAPVSGSYEGSLSEEKEFLAQAIPFMFRADSADAAQALVVGLSERGAAGYAVIALSLLIPVGIMMYPILRPRAPRR